MLIMQTLTTLNCKNRLLDVSSPVVAGIINVTPDSFYAASRAGSTPGEIADFAGKMLSEGAAILDIGGMSSRPGAQEISLQEEIDRVVPVISLLTDHFPEIILSIDTYRAQVAKAALEAGASIVNDISGGNADPELWKVVSDYKAAYVLMHMRGNPSTMQSMTDYEDVISDLVKYFVNKIRELHQSGIRDIIIDPGFGFAKTMDHNYQVIRHLKVFSYLGLPLMVGVSRKSTLRQTIGRPAEETLEATTALHMAALVNGASILRAHDVRPAMDTIRVFNKLRDAKNHSYR
jgi:dihydropteroate synthase